MSKATVQVKRIRNSGQAKRARRYEALLDIQNLSPGDELAVPRSYFHVPYFHHRIVLEVDVASGTYTAAEYTISNLWKPVGCCSYFGADSDCEDDPCELGRSPNAHGRQEHDLYFLDSCPITLYRGLRSHKGNVVKVRKHFLGSKYTNRVLYDDEHALPATTTLQRAFALLGTQPVYHWLFNNCEHFTSWCKTGKAFSLQVVGFEHRVLLRSKNSSKLAGLTSRTCRKGISTDSQDSDSNTSKKNILLISASSTPP